jgi:hypothetical protein
VDDLILANKDWTPEKFAEKFSRELATGTMAESPRKSSLVPINFKSEKAGYVTSASAEAARRIVTHMDNTFGMVNYDRLFMNPKMKHLSMAKDLAFGWKTGNFRIALKGMDEMLNAVDLGTAGAARALQSKGFNKAGIGTEGLLGYRNLKKQLGGTGYSSTEGSHFHVMNFVASAAIMTGLMNYAMRAVGIANPIRDWKDLEGDWNQKIAMRMEDLLFPAMSNKMNQYGEYSRYSYGYMKDLYEIANPRTWYKSASYFAVGGLSPASQLLQDTVGQYMQGKTPQDAIGRPLGDPRFLPDGARASVNDFADEYPWLSPFIGALSELGNRALPISASSFQANKDQGMNPAKAFIVGQTGFRMLPRSLELGKSHAEAQSDRLNTTAFQSDRDVHTQLNYEKANRAIRDWVNDQHVGSPINEASYEQHFQNLLDAGYSKKKIDNAVRSFTDADGNFRPGGLERSFDKLLVKSKLSALKVMGSADDNQLKSILPQVRRDMDAHEKTWNATGTIERVKLRDINKRLSRMGLDPLPEF